MSIPLLTVVVPMPKSLRSNAKVSDDYRKRVARACGGRKLPADMPLRVVMLFYARWTTASNKLRRRDHLNYAAVLCDVLSAALGIDDSRMCVLELRKIESPLEIVKTHLYPTAPPT